MIDSRFEDLLSRRSDESDTKNAAGSLRGKPEPACASAAVNVRIGVDSVHGFEHRG